MFSKTFLAAVFAAVAAAQSNSDNPTSAPAINEAVAGCKPFTLAWTPTTKGTVSIEIISGASDATLVPVGVVASGIANSGSFSWTPAAALGANAVTGYKIIDDATGQFQYSVPFKVTPCEDEPTTSEKPTDVTATAVDYPTASETMTPEPTEVIQEPVPSSICTFTSTVYVMPSAPACPGCPGAPPAGTGYPPAPPAGTGAPVPPYPTNPSVDTTLYPTATGTGGGVYPTAPPEFEGAGSAVKAGLGLAGAAAAFALML